MRSFRSILSLALLCLVTACGPGIRVNTVASPGVSFGRLHTFRILEVPSRRHGRSGSPGDPMLVNSISYRALRQALRAGFEKRGYTVAESNPDFTVAYYASAREKLDISVWDYGYRWRPGWWRGWGPGPVADVDEYTEGTVIVDVVDPTSHDLIWRGRGVGVVSDVPEEYAKDLRKTAMAIVDQFPAAAH